MNIAEYAIVNGTLEIDVTDDGKVVLCFRVDPKYFDAEGWTTLLFTPPQAAALSEALRWRSSAATEVAALAAQRKKTEEPAT